MNIPKNSENLSLLMRSVKLCFQYLSNSGRLNYYVQKYDFKVNLISLLSISVINMPFYAVAIGKIPGVYKTWEECQNQTKGYPKAKYKKFNTEVEASNFINKNRTQSEDMDTVSSTSYMPFRTENIKLPELKAVNKYPSKALLKQDKLSPIAEKLDKFIEETSKTLCDFSKRLEALETSVLSKTTSDGKRIHETIDEGKTRNLPKKKKQVETDEEKCNLSTRNKTQSVNGAEEEIDSPWSNINTSNDSFIIGPDGYVVVYTDGACSNNGRQGAKAGIGVWFNHSNPFNVAAPVEGNATNNNAEIQAATRAIQQASLAGITKLNVHTDSQFMINCMTDWIKKWKKNNWVTSNGGPVKNKEQLILLDESINNMASVKWTHIRGHMGNEGNECADALARTGATMY